MVPKSRAYLATSVTMVDPSGRVLGSQETSQPAGLHASWKVPNSSGAKPA